MFFPFTGYNAATAQFYPSTQKFSRIVGLATNHKELIVYHLT